MRLFLVSILILFIATGYSLPWPWSAPDASPEESSSAVTDAPLPPFKMRSKKDIKCYEAEIQTYKNGSIKKETEKEKTCNGWCNIHVSNMSIDDIMKGWYIYCGPTNFVGELENECGYSEFSTTWTNNMDTFSIHCRCDTDHCFTAEIGEQAYAQLSEGAKKWNAGERAFKGLFDIRSPSAVQDTSNTGTGPRTALSATSVLLSIAAFVLAT